MKICPECKKQVDESFKECPYCGFPFDGNETHVKGKICPECHKEIPMDAQECPYCDYNFSQAERVLKMKADAEEAERRAKKAALELEQAEFRQKQKDEQKKRDEVKKRRDEELQKKADLYQKQIEASKKQEQEAKERLEQITEHGKDEIQNEGIENKHKVNEEPKVKHDQIGQQEYSKNKEAIENKTTDIKEHKTKNIEVRDEKKNENIGEIKRLKRIRTILAGVSVIACVGLLATVIISSNSNKKNSVQISSLESQLSKVTSDNNSINSELELAQSTANKANQEKSAVQSEYDAYKEKMAPFEKMTEAQAEQKTAEANAAKAESDNQKAANEAVNKLWDDNSGLKAGATRDQYNDAVSKVNKVGNTAAKNALNTKLKAINDAMSAKEKADAAEQAAGYETGITYDQIARTPDQYQGKKVKFRGKVIQVIEGDGENGILLAVNSNYNKVLYGTYNTSIVSSRILENDTITIYGTSTGTYSYTSTQNEQITVPGISIDKIDQ